MSSGQHSTGEAKRRGEDLSREAPDGQIDDSSYATGRGEPIPVQKDSDLVDDPVDADTVDTDAQLGRSHTCDVPYDAPPLISSQSRMTRRP